LICQVSFDVETLSFPRRRESTQTQCRRDVRTYYSEVVVPAEAEISTNSVQTGRPHLLLWSCRSRGGGNPAPSESRRDDT